VVKDIKIRRVPASFRYAARGIWHILRTEQNLQIHLVATALAIGLGVYFRISPGEFALVLLAIGLVLIAEVINTVAEDLLDIIHPAHHPVVRRIKDALAGAVLVAAIIALTIATLVFGPYLLAGFR
jgi:diacylglycerol kinase